MSEREEAMGTHEVLVAARNGMERDGWDVGECAEGAGCGTPRCALGWVAFCSHPQADVWDVVLDHHRQALEALWEAAPADARVHQCDRVHHIAYRVEDVAFALDTRQGVDGEVPDAIADWFDRAIAETAPPPADPLREVVAAEGPSPERCSGVPA